MRICYKYTLITVLAVTASCAQFVKKAAKESASPDGNIPAEVVSDENGVMVAKYDPSSTTTTTIGASESSELAGAAVIFKAGSLSEATDITIQSGASLAENDVASALDLLDQNPITGQGPTVMISAAKVVDVREAFTIRLPLPRKNSLQGEGWERLVLIYKAARSEGDGYVIGLIPMANIKIDGDFASVGTTLFGAYQAVLTTEIVADEVKKISKVPVLSKNEWEAKKAANTVPTFSATLTDIEGHDSEVVVGEQGLPLAVVSDTPSSTLNIFFEDPDADIVKLTVAYCPAWAECKVYDDLTAKPSIAIKATASRKDGGNHKILISSKDFFGDTVNVPVIISVVVPVIYGPPVGLKFVDYPQTQDAVSCLEYAIAAIDKDGLVTRPSEQVIAFFSAGSGSFYKDKTCTIQKATDSITFGPEIGVVKVYYKNPNPQTFQLAVFAPEALKWAPARLERSIVPGAPSQLRFANLQEEIDAGECLALTVTATDAVGNARTAGPALNAVLGGLNSNFFSEATCTSVIVGNQLTIAGGAAAASFYYRNTKAPGDSLTATVTSATNWKVGSLFVEVRPAAITKIDFTGRPESLQVNTCTMFVVGTLDAFNNLSPAGAEIVYSLTSTDNPMTGDFYADADCMTLLSPAEGGGRLLSQAAGEVEIKGYFKPTSGSASPVSLSATASGVGSATVSNLPVTTPTP